MIEPSGTIVPCSSTSRCTHRACTGDGDSSRRISSIAVGIERRVLDEQTSLVRVLGEQLHREPDEAGRRLVAGAGDHAGVGDDLVSGERTPRPVGLVDLGVQQLGHEVVGRVLRTPLDVVASTDRTASNDDWSNEIGAPSVAIASSVLLRYTS